MSHDATESKKLIDSYVDTDDPLRIYTPVFSGLKGWFQQ